MTDGMLIAMYCIMRARALSCSTNDPRLGQWMLRTFEAIAIEAGVRQTMLTCFTANKPAQAFFVKQGYGLASTSGVSLPLPLPLPSVPRTSKYSPKSTADRLLCQARQRPAKLGAVCCSPTFHAVPVLTLINMHQKPELN